MSAASQCRWSFRLRLRCVTMRAFPIFLLLARLAFAAQPADGNSHSCVEAIANRFAAGCSVVDLDGDHQPDFALSPNLRGIGHEPVSIAVRLSQGQPDQDLKLPEGRLAFRFRTLDVDGDGDLDIAVDGDLNQTVGVFLNDSKGGFHFDADDRYLSQPHQGSSQFAAPADESDVLCLADDETPFAAGTGGGEVQFQHSRPVKCSLANGAIARQHASPTRIRAP